MKHLLSSNSPAIYILGALTLAMTLTATARGQAVSYFPRVLATSDVTTGLALSNPTADPAVVTLTFIDSDGTTAGSPATVSVGSAGQIARLSTEWFPESQNRRGWVRMNSNISGVMGFYLNGNFVTTTDGGDFATPAKAITFPWIAHSGSTSTEITLTNPNDAAASVQLSLFGANGSLIQSRTTNIPRNAQLAGSIQTLLEVNTLETGYLRAESSDLLIGAEVVRDGSKDFAMLNAREDAPSRALIFPHIATGGGYSTALFVHNTSAIRQQVTLEFFLDSGAAGASSVSVELSPGQLLRRTVDEAFNVTGPNLQTGWVRATADADVLEGFQVFLVIESGGITALPARKAGSSRLLQSHIAEQTSAVFRPADLFTGLALLNPSDQPAEAAVTIVTREGAVLADSTQNLAPRQKRAFLLRETMPEVLGETSGTVWVRSSVPIYALQVFGTWDLALLSQIPAQSTASISRPATPGATRYAISGRISAATALALGNVTVEASGPMAATATTDHSGAFVLKYLAPGTYVLTPRRSDLTFSPPATTVSVAGNSPGIGFAASASTSEIGGGASGGGSTGEGGSTGGGSAGGGSGTSLQISPQEVEIRVSSTVGVGAYQISFRFNPSVLSLAVSGVTGGAEPFQQTPTAINIDNNSGEVTINSFQLAGAPAGTFAVARLRFTPKAAGSSNLTMTQTEVFNAIGNAISSATVNFSTSTLTVQ